ncbi:flavin monoamine oxidase family protein [Catenuloplanes japonicus]|uniref:flavin monoamine oxidase family protein n=1 Tax=Catenuloplanes japonicus TaxID=33876 RepID=UPI000A692E87|nr:NAD(P)/FAD-dependent oxidoreductase [Catenuloplanes japonicus]
MINSGQDADVVVVGAGVSGLMTAVRLHEAGRRVIVLEARDRVGGRLLTETHDGVRLEIGGQWVSPDQTAVLALLDELDLPTFPRHRAGESVYIGRDGVRRTFTGEAFPVSATTAAEVDRLTAELDMLAAAMDPLAPWDHPDAAALDRISFAAWLESRTGDAEARDNVGLYIGPAMLTKPAHTFSALTAVLMAASAGAFSHLVDADFILDRRVEGGLQQVPLHLAARLPDGVIRLGVPVTEITWDANGATVKADKVYKSGKVVVAVPPTLVDRIRFAPALPPVHRQMRQHQSFGMVIKLHVSYDRPFWRDHGLSGTAFSPYRVVHEAYDNCNEDLAGDTRGTLVGFVSDVQADRLLTLTPEARRAEVLDALAGYYGAEARHPVAYYESPWAADEWTGGAFGTSFGIGALTRYNSLLREDVGPIAFISSDIAGLGFLHVDGAVRMGESAAARLLGRAS